MIHDPDNQVEITKKSGSLDKAEADRLLGQVAEEFFDRVSRGEQPSIEDYANRYPEIAELIRDSFAAVHFLDHSIADTPECHGAETPTQRSIGDFRILREIGRGGMGVVYEAEQLSLGRSVALKVLPYAAMLDQMAIKRFKNEARAAATLDHPNIVPVHAVGNERGIYYYAMSLIEGLTLAELITKLQQDITNSEHSTDRISLDRKLGRHYDASVSYLDPTIDSGQSTKAQTRGPSVSPPTYQDVQAAISTHRSRFDRDFFRLAARVGAQAAEALEHAHQHGIVHRDIKPGNLMMDAQSKLWITDFGLARIESDARMTMTGDLIGTLRYMAPEQALAKRVVVDHRADIYALGATLYELLALRPAFDGSNRESLLKQIAFEEAESLRNLNGSVPENLQTIIHKAISKNADDRYQTAQEMGDDLNAFINDEPIKARPLSMAQRTSRWAGQHKGLIASMAAVLLLVMLGLSISNAMIREQRDVAEAAQEKEREARLEAEQQREEADSQRQKADRQTQLAEANAKTARDTVDRFLTKVGEEQLLNADSMQPLRKELLQLALSYYQEFISQQPKDTELIEELADAYMRVGRINMEMGLAKDARPAFENALELRQSLASMHPDMPKYLLDLSTTKRSIGNAQQQAGELENAARTRTEAMAILEDLHVAYPQQNDVKLALAKMYCNPDVHSSLSEALEFRQHGIALLESLVERHPEVIKYRVELASALGSEQAKEHDEATVSEVARDRRKAVELLEGIVAQERSIVAYQSKLAMAYGNLAYSQMRLGSYDEFFKSSQAGIQILERLSNRNPLVSLYRYNLSVVYGNVYLVHLRLNEFKQAREFLEKAIETLEPMAMKSRPNLNNLIKLYSTLMELNKRLEEPSEAIETCERYVRLFKQIPDAEKTAADWSCFGQVLYDFGRFEEARQAFEKTLELRGETTPTIERGPRWWYMAILLARTGDLEKARSYYDILIEEMQRKRSAIPPHQQRMRSELAGLLGIR